MALYQRDDDFSRRGFGPHPVGIVTHSTIPIENDLLAFKAWMPTLKLSKNFPEAKDVLVYCDGQEASEEERFPCVLEYLPYRKSDWTAPRDHERHPWLASHGYVVLRVDFRGSGDSTGLMRDEYTAQELDDAVKIIEWASTRLWSNGKVGMFGKSWGGFNGLQTAFLRPKALKAVISLYSTDNRFTDDIHWKGGCVLGIGMLNWASVMFAWKADPPNPSNVLDWKDVWRRRLEESSESWAQLWLSHNSYDDYWKHGSICEDYARLDDVNVLLIGGWHDAYTNAVFRMVDRLKNVKALIGPWSHMWPDVATPGPNIGFMTECLHFWNKHLKGKQSQKVTPKLTWFQCHGEVAPCPKIDAWPGYWHAIDSSPTNLPTMKLILAKNGILTQEPRESEARVIKFNANCGLWCGEWLSFGEADLPPDQRMANTLCETWTTSTLDKVVADFGFPTLTADVAILNDVEGQIVVRICDVFPTGEIRLVSYGVSLLTQKGPFKVDVELDAVGYTFKKGHKIEIAVSSSYWPTIWTPKRATEFELSKAELQLPLVDKSLEVDFELSKTPLKGPRMASIQLREPKLSRNLDFDLAGSKRVLTSIDDGGRTKFPALKLTMDEVTKNVFSIDDQIGPLSANATTNIKRRIEFHQDKDIIVDVETFSQLSADENKFDLINELEVKLNGETFFTRKWKDEIDR